MEPRAFRGCEEKSTRCCSLCVRRSTWRFRALSTRGLSDGTSHGRGKELGVAGGTAPFTADIPEQQLEQEETGMTEARTSQKDPHPEWGWRYLRQFSSFQQEMGEDGARTKCTLTGLAWLYEPGFPSLS